MYPLKKHEETVYTLAVRFSEISSEILISSPTSIKVQDNLNLAYNHKNLHLRLLIFF